MKLTTAAKLLLIAIITGLLTAALVASPGHKNQAEAGPVLSVSGSNVTAFPGETAALRLQLLNHTDQILYNGQLSATLPDGFTYVPGSTLVLGDGGPLAGQEPIIAGQSLTWGPYHLPAAVNRVHNPYGIHTMIDACASPPALHMEGAKRLTGNGGYVTQLLYPITTTTTGPSQCAINIVNEAYARNLIPILRLQGERVNNIWQAPDPGPAGDYAAIAQAYARFVAGLPRRNSMPLYIAVWNEPDLWIEWSNRPNATEYARFFVAVSQAIRQLGDNRIRLVNGALTPGNTTFISRMLQTPGFRDAFDVWASHCYPYNHPAWYNSYLGTAKYPTYAIDCYRQEVALLNRAGRSNVYVLLTETGYKLNDDTFRFENKNLFPRIDQTNRAGYIASAFGNFWSQWPEVVGVTPFELTDPGHFWVDYDWLHPTYPFTPTLQYTTVAALPKPGAGQLTPIGFAVSLKITVDQDTAPGSYPVSLSGSEQNGSAVLSTQAMTITVVPPFERQLIYLPLIVKPRPATGPWYGPAETTANDDGAIIPTHFLAPAAVTAQTAPTIDRLTLPAEALALTIDTGLNLGAALLADGSLQLFQPTPLTLLDSLWLGTQPQTMISGEPGRVYVSLADELLQIDLTTRQIVQRRPLPHRPNGLAWDAAGQRLFVSFGDPAQLTVFDAALNRELAATPLNDQPDKLLLSTKLGRLFVSFPGASRVAALHPDTLSTLAEASLTGGPLLDMALSADGRQLAVLNALTPRYRGLTVLDAATLTPLALVAESPGRPLRTAAALAAAPAGPWLTVEPPALWAINPTDFSTRPQDISADFVPPGGLLPQSDGVTYLLADRTLLRIAP